MRIPKLASTLFLTVAICTLYLFALIFYLLLNADPKTATVLKDSLTLTSSFFGGIATLVAAYIATKLFNDWRDEKKFQILKDKVEFANTIINEMHDNLSSVISYKINELEILRKSFFNLYEILLSIDLKSDNLDIYKELHLVVAEIIINLLTYGNRPLNEDEVKYILYYRGVILKMRTNLANHLENFLKDS